MFSIFHGLFSLFAIIVNDINKQTQEEENKSFAKKHNNLIYKSSKGNRLITNDRLVYTTYNKSGHRVISDLYNDKEYYDITSEKIKKRRQKSKEWSNNNNLDTYLCENDKRYAKGTKKISTTLFDIDTDEPVSEIYINGIMYYISYDTGLITRVDRLYINCFGKQINKYKDFICVIDPNEIIKVFNKRQHELQNSRLYNIDTSWMKEVYYLRPGLSKSPQLYMDILGRIGGININNNLIKLRNEGLPELIEI